MKIFTRPTNLNGAELINELKSGGIIVDEIWDLGDGTIAFNTKDETTASAIVANHNGNIVPPALTIEQKLANAGLSIEDLRTALGL